MRRIAWLSLLSVALVSASVQGVIIVPIPDPVDDTGLVGAVRGQKPVRQLGAEIEALQRAIAAHKRERIEKILGRPVPKRVKDYAMPVAQPRVWTMSGLRYGVESMNKDHTEFYTVGDFAGIEVWYGIDGDTPRIVLVYLKVDEAFPKLKRLMDEAAGQPAKVAAVRKNTIDRSHWQQLKPHMSKKEITEIFGVPPGDYAPGMEYFSNPYGTMSTDGRKGSETLEWRGERGRAAVEFDEKDTLVTSEFCEPGRDPATNLAERLKWERGKVDRLKKYVEERLAAK